MDAPKLSIYYDGLCRGCDAVARTLANSARADLFRLQDANTVDPQMLPDRITRDAAMRDVHVVDETGRQYIGFSAVLKILEQYPRWRWLAKVGYVPVLKQVGTGLYRLIADNRYWLFGRKHVS
ncbi:DUF393 domain-containing protein [Candidatus Kaiserbacteria bacterium]|nr:DUF393 domain-containing protein [Candidatus Kaiserbacteria bacterium]